jgi:hypothetical protein
MIIRLVAALFEPKYPRHYRGRHRAEPPARPGREAEAN